MDNQETSIATFHSLRGESKKTALVMVKANPLQFSADPVYVPVVGLEYFSKGVKVKDMEAGHEIEIPGGYKLVDIMDYETGEIRTTKDGTPLKQLAW